MQGSDRFSQFVPDRLSPGFCGVSKAGPIYSNAVLGDYGGIYRYGTVLRFSCREDEKSKDGKRYGSFHLIVLLSAKNRKISRVE